MHTKTVFRIYTEDLRRKDVIATVAEKFQGFTVYYAKGYWAHKPENTLVIEIIEKYDYKPNIIEVCNRIKKLNDQQAVLLTEEHSVITSFI